MSHEVLLMFKEDILSFLSTNAHSALTAFCNDTLYMIYLLTYFDHGRL